MFDRACHFVFLQSSPPQTDQFVQAFLLSKHVQNAPQLASERQRLVMITIDFLRGARHNRIYRWPLNQIMENENKTTPASGIPPQVGTRSMP